MIGVEKRKGKMKPVITKYLVELDGQMYKAYKKFRKDWAIFDCYQSPGPIQFHEPHRLSIPFLVEGPDIEKMEEETKERIALETERGDEVGPYFPKCPSNQSKLSREMREYEPLIPEVLQDPNHKCFAVKKF